MSDQNANSIVQQGEMTLQVQRQDPEATVLAVSGAVGMMETEPFKQHLEQLLAEHPSVLVLELSQLQFISSMGLGAIIAAHLNARRAGCILRLVHPSKQVREVLQITNLTKILPLYESVEQALQDISGRNA